MDKFSELKAAALDATPGPWHLVDQACRWNIDDGNGVPVAITQQRTSTFNDRIQSDRTANTVFIAAANPAVVLALLAELEAKDKRIAELSRLLTHNIERAESAEAKLATPVRLPRTLWYEHDELMREVPVMEKKKVIAAIRAAGFTVEGDE